jgi:leucyl-tRNA synthetase
MSGRVASLKTLSAEEQKGIHTDRRDILRSIEADMRAKWEAEKTYEVDAKDLENKEKFFATFPYPYMNGRLHLGHAFTVTKADFAAGYQMLQGKQVLFPFAFHCTGMPIQAAANKLKREIEDYGLDNCRSGFFDGGVEAAAAAERAANAETSVEKLLAAAAKGPRGKKTKLAAKQGGVKRQWTILKKNGIPDDEIPNFVDAEHWLRYFPPYGMSDLKLFGLHTDWRRSFITTSTNPYYDSFIRWQFRALKKAGKIDFGRRPTIYSIRDGQACADHDRSSGEGVNPQAYTLIKLRMLEPSSVPALEGKLSEAEQQRVFLVAATLRPETMYGQTNCFVLPSGQYAAYRLANGDVFVCSKKSALNMSYQDLIEPRGKPEEALVAELSGAELLGQPVDPPLSPYERVYCLPLLTISMDKGTGVVTSVPSDAPDDYAALKDLQVRIFQEHGFSPPFAPVVHDLCSPPVRVFPTFHAEV